MDSRSNEAQSVAALEHSQLSLGALDMHSSVAYGSVLRLAKSASLTKTIRSRAFLFTSCLLAYTAVTWVLSVVFIVEWFSSGDYNHKGVAGVRLPVAMPVAELDPCWNSTGARNCYYNLASAPLTTLLVTQNWTYVGGVRLDPTFEGPAGIPFDIFDHFSDYAGNTTFPSMDVQYCAPRLLPKSFSCKEDVGNSRVRYEYQNVFAQSGLYRVTIDPDTPYEMNYPRPADANGDISTWTIASSRHNGSLDTIITANDAGARLLSKMAWINSTFTNASQPFTMICTLEARYIWSWQNFKYTDNLFWYNYRSGLLSGSACSNDPAMSPDEYRRSNIPFVNLPAAIEGSTTAIGSFTGYSRLLNLDSDTFIDEPSGREMRYSQSFAESSDMTELELYLSAIYSTITTMHPAALSEGINRTSIQYVSTTYTYRITVTWTALSVVAQIAVLIIFASTIWQAVYWAKATLSTETSVEDRDLLSPLNLAAYSASIADDLKAIMQDDADSKLRVPRGDGVCLGPAGV